MREARAHQLMAKTYRCMGRGAHPAMITDSFGYRRALSDHVLLGSYRHEIIVVYKEEGNHLIGVPELL